MAQDVSFHLRPIFTERDGMDVLAVTDIQILLELWQKGFRVGRIQQSEEEAALVLSEPLEGPENYLHPPRSLGLLPRAAFMDDRTLLMIDDVQDTFRVIRAADPSFQKILERNASPLTLDAIARRLTVREGNAYAATNSSFVSQIWKISVPDPKSSPAPVNVEKCGEYQGSEIKTGTSNGRIHAGKLIKLINSRPWCGNFIGDLQSGHYHIIDGSEDDYIQVSGDMFLLWTISWDTLGLSIFRLVDGGKAYTQNDYEARIPMPDRQVEILTLKMEIYIAESGGGRFFLKRDHEILMGYLPGADVPLEDVAAATVWRSLPKNAQRELLNKNRLSRREILLRAMDVHDKKKPKKRQNQPGSSMVLRKRRR